MDSEAESRSCKGCQEALGCGEEGGEENAEGLDFKDRTSGQAHSPCHVNDSGSQSYPCLLRRGWYWILLKKLTGRLPAVGSIDAFSLAMSDPKHIGLVLPPVPEAGLL
jgi:hypothetical protein